MFFPILWENGKNVPIFGLPSSKSCSHPIIIEKCPLDIPNTFVLVALVDFFLRTIFFFFTISSSLHNF